MWWQRRTRSGKGVIRTWGGRWWGQYLRWNKTSKNQNLTFNVLLKLSGDRLESRSSQEGQTILLLPVFFLQEKNECSKVMNGRLVWNHVQVRRKTKRMRPDVKNRNRLLVVGEEERLKSGLWSNKTRQKKRLSNLFSELVHVYIKGEVSTGTPLPSIERCGILLSARPLVIIDMKFTKYLFSWIPSTGPVRPQFDRLAPAHELSDLTGASQPVTHLLTLTVLALTGGGKHWWEYVFVRRYYLLRACSSSGPFPKMGCFFWLVFAMAATSSLSPVIL